MMIAIIASLSTFGANSQAIWLFAAGIMVVVLVAALILMGVAFIKRLVNM